MLRPTLGRFAFCYIGNMSNYASIKGANRPCNDIRIERKRTIKKKSGSRLRHQFVDMGTEDFVFIPERTFRTLGGESFTYPATIHTRPVLRHITHAK